jgi:UDP-N-acetylmuramoylalanine--D-glutamate ligase
MIRITKHRGHKVGILGFGATGLSAAESLNKGGADVLVWDDHQPRRCFAARSGFAIIDFCIEGLGDLDLLFVSPGVPLVYPEPHPVVALARSSGIRIISDIELLQASCPSARYIGVTGTNGKSTVTSLLGHVLLSSGKIVQAGGNLGNPALSLQMLDSNGTYVLELSSYQLDLTREVFFDVAVWTNLSPDHIDRHGTFDGYIRAKKNIFDGRGGYAVIGVDDEVSQNLFNELVEKYPGLPHRMEKIATVDGVTYINDSKATNVAATAKALSCFQKLYWIVGGQAKNTSVKELLPVLSGVVHAYTIGESGKHFEEMLQEWVPVTNSGTLAAAFDQATNLAAGNTDSGAVVLLSPGCASFDQFLNFEARGEVFRKLVAELRTLETDDEKSAMDGACQ